MGRRGSHLSAATKARISASLRAHYSGRTRANRDGRLGRKPKSSLNSNPLPKVGKPYRLKQGNQVWTVNKVFPNGQVHITSDAMRSRRAGGNQNRTVHASELTRVRHRKQAITIFENGVTGRFEVRDRHGNLISEHPSQSAATRRVNSLNSGVKTTTLKVTPAVKDQAHTTKVGRQLTEAQKAAKRERARRRRAAKK